MPIEFKSIKVSYIVLSVVSIGAAKTTSILAAKTLRDGGSDYRRTACRALANAIRLGPPSWPARDQGRISFKHLLVNLSVLDSR
jgi:hypothetical protein